MANDDELVSLPLVTFDRLRALEQAAIGALKRSCIGCAGGMELDEGWAASDPSLHFKTVGPEVQTLECTADPILREAVATLVSPV